MERVEEKGTGRTKFREAGNVTITYTYKNKGIMSYRDPKLDPIEEEYEDEDDEGEGKKEEEKKEGEGEAPKEGEVDGSKTVMAPTIRAPRQNRKKGKSSIREMIIHPNEPHMNLPPYR